MITNIGKVFLQIVLLRISPYSVRMRENTGKIRARITPNTDTFCAVPSLAHLPSSLKSFVNAMQGTLFYFKLILARKLKTLVWQRILYK